jgi:DNA-binding NarL/FixJ family response regulator
MKTLSHSETSAKSVRVLLADDHTLVRAGIRALLEKLPGMEVAGEADNGREVMNLIQAQQPDVVLLDISMPGLNGLQALARITRDFPPVRVIMLSMHHNDEYVLQALKSAASGYLLKRAATAELPAALRTVLAGDIYISREIASRFLKKFPLQQIAHARGPLDQLTQRQREILQLLAEGHTTKATALVLKLSDKTVEYHRAQLMARLNIFDIAGLVRFALQTGLVSPESSSLQFLDRGSTAGGGLSPVGLGPNTFNLPPDAGEVPAPMTGAQRGNKVQAHPAPMFLTQVGRHTFAFILSQQ